MQKRSLYDLLFVPRVFGFCYKLNWIERLSFLSQQPFAVELCPENAPIQRHKIHSREYSSTVDLLVLT